MLIIKLILNKLIKNWFKSLLIIFNFFLVISFALFFVFFYKNLEGFFIKQSIGNIEELRFDIVEKYRYGKIIGNSDESTINNVFELLSNDDKIDSVIEFYSTSLPVSITVDFFGNQIQTDILVFAVADKLFESKGINVNTDIVPIGLSQGLIDFYNLQVANGDFFPKLGQALFLTLKFYINFGESTFLNRKNDKTVKKEGRIKLLDPILPMVGISIPYSYIKNITQDMDNIKFDMYRIVGYVKEIQYLDELEKKYSKDFDFSTTNKQLAEIREKLKGVRLFLIFINIVVLLILISFVIYVVYFILEGNHKIFKILRLHGANRLKILSIIIFEKLLYFTFALILVYFLFIIWSNFLLPQVNQVLSEKLFLDYTIVNISFLDFLFINFIYVSLILFITIVLSFKEWNKKFDI